MPPTLQSHIQCLNIMRRLRICLASGVAHILGCYFMRYWGSSLLTAGKVKWYQCYFVIIVLCSSSKVLFFRSVLQSCALDVLRQECLISVNILPSRCFVSWPAHNFNSLQCSVLFCKLKRNTTHVIHHIQPRVKPQHISGTLV